MNLYVHITEEKKLYCGNLRIAILELLFVQTLQRISDVRI